MSTDPLYMLHKSYVDYMNGGITTKISIFKTIEKCQEEISICIYNYNFGTCTNGCFGSDSESKSKSKSKTKRKCHTCHKIPSVQTISDTMNDDYDGNFYHCIGDISFVVSVFSLDLSSEGDCVCTRHEVDIFGNEPKEC